jgi:hypothetical protein
MNNEGGNFEEAQVYIIDAYFDLLDSRSVYSCILFYIHVKSREGLFDEAPGKKRSLQEKYKIKPSHIFKNISWENLNEMSLSKQESNDMDSMAAEEKSITKNDITDIDSEYL